jgi:galactoside 2-L-fucosyltransferase 1/2
MLQRRSELLSEFQWRPELKRDVHEYIEQITVNHVYSTLVGIHVRMQDYHSHLTLFNKNVQLPGPKYFNQSMNYYNNKYGNPLFLVVSNDMNWCEENVKGANVIYAGRKTLKSFFLFKKNEFGFELTGKGIENDPGWDLALLTSCDHLIITYGSYGVMAAYLNAGKHLHRS